MKPAHLLLAGIIGTSAFAQEPAPKLAPSGEEQAAMIAAIRQKALDYSEHLPDFLCTQVTRRYSGGPKAAKEPAWKLSDTLSIRVSFFGQHEKYQVFRIDDKLTDTPFDRVPGNKTTGEFGSLLKAIFIAKSEARFNWNRWDTVNGRPVAALSYRIEKEHSQFASTAHRPLHNVRMNWAGQGMVYADAETHQVVRITLDSVDMPPNSPAQDIHITVDYGVRKIGEKEFVLPVQSESRLIGAGKFLRAESQFTEYRKFSADTEITYKQQ